MEAARARRHGPGQRGDEPKYDWNLLALASFGVPRAAAEAELQACGTQGQTSVAWCSYSLGAALSCMKEVSCGVVEREVVAKCGRGALERRSVVLLRGESADSDVWCVRLRSVGCINERMDRGIDSDELGRQGPRRRALFCCGLTSNDGQTAADCTLTKCHGAFLAAASGMPARFPIMCVVRAPARCAVEPRFAPTGTCRVASGWALRRTWAEARASVESDRCVALTALVDDKVRSM